MKLVVVTRYSLMAKAVLAAHRGRRDEMSAALLEFGEHGGEGSEAAPLAHGLGRGFGALLQEDRAAADLEMAAVAAEESRRQSPFHLAGSYGLALLLDVLAGRADQQRWQKVSANPVSRMRWNRHFVALAAATLAGRTGDTSAADTWMRTAAEAGEPFATARHLGLRLVAEAALTDGWGEPKQWLRDAEEHFFQRQVIAVAGACRTLLRRTGEPVRQRRAGTSRIPDHLRRLGITSREFEVLELLPGRLSNKALAARLHISPRTVEKHVASLLLKTGLSDRDALFDRAAELLAQL
jgi:DNA-binding CsgD family transcriptional regulator